MFLDFDFRRRLQHAVLDGENVFLYGAFADFYMVLQIFEFFFPVETPAKLRAAIILLRMGNQS